MNRLYYVVASLLVFSSVGCVQAPPIQPDSKNPLTSGQVSLTLKKNQTTQTEVIEVFGAPNLVTSSSNGDESWTYQKHATISTASSTTAYATIFLFGGSSRSSGLEQSSRTMTLIIKFKELNGIKTVVDFSSRASSF